MENNNKCDFGECKIEEKQDYKKCCEIAKKLGYTGCVYAKYNPKY